MASKQQLLEVVPHYVAMIALVLVVMTLIRMVFDLDNFVIEFALILVLVFAYRPLVLRLPFIPTPTIWEQQESE